MDFFHTLQWADDEGRYTEGKSFYPPLNFLFLKVVKLIFIGGSSFPNAFSLRDSGFSAVLFLTSSYLIAPIILMKSKLWNCFSNAEKTKIYFILILSTPMLFALERGNLIIFTLIILPFVFSHSNIARIVSIAVLINLKPYFALLLVYFLVKRYWRQFVQCTLLAGILFFVTGILLDNNFLHFFSNIFDWSQNSAILSVKEIMAMPSSISAFSYVFDSTSFQHTKFGSFFNLHLLSNLISVLKWTVIAWLLIALRKNHIRLSDFQIIAILLVIISNLGVWVGGYSLIFYILLIPVFLTMRFSIVYLVILILLFAPLEVIPLARASIGEQYSYLTNSIVEVNWFLGMGSIVKPILNFILMVVLLYEIRQQSPLNSVGSIERGSV